MKRKEVNPIDIDTVVELIQRKGATRPEDIGAAFGWSRDYLRQVLDACLGLKTYRIDRLTHYMTAAECASRKIAAERAKRARWARNRNRANVAAASLDNYEGVEDVGDWLPNRPNVPAAVAVPLLTKAPRWVFEWRPS